MSYKTHQNVDDSVHFEQNEKGSAPETDRRRSALLDSEVPAFPLEVLPEPARRLVEAGARLLGCPPDLIAVPVLGTLASAIGTNRRIEVKPGWEEYASIYAVVIAEPGSAKTPAQRLATEPIHQEQERFWEEHRNALAEYLDKSKQAARVEGSQKQKSGAGNHSVGPIPRQLVSTESTVEALGLLLKENPHGILSDQDEIVALTASFNRYRTGLGADRQFYQSA
jgi:hypothetical protein